MCDAHSLCSGEYLFSELFVFFCACSAHSLFSSLLFVFVFVLGGGASQRQRDERLHRLTLPSFFSLLAFLLFISCLWYGGCRVVRAQLCEHARNTTSALCVFGLST
nr:MAG TPA: hypothetical protein [Caudoviricetes sp.]